MAGYLSAMEVPSGASTFERKNADRMSGSDSIPSIRFWYAPVYHGDCSMVRFPRLAFGVLFIWLALVSNADAFGGRFGIWPSSASYYSTYAVPAYWIQPYYCIPAPTIVPVPDAPRMPYARPTPAPPSQSAEPPLHRSGKAPSDLQAPVVGGNYASNTAPSTGKDRCRVGFWNLTGRDVTLTVDGKTWSLAKDRATTLELDRRFTWQADRQSERAVSVPEGQSTFEVVIR
jgi:hypothetical protein